MALQTRGRPGRYARFDQLYDSLKPGEKKRATYVDGIGVFRGERGATVWVKLTIRKPNRFKGRSYSAGEALEIKLGAKDSWSWAELEAERNRLQGLADRGEPLEEAKTEKFRDYACQTARNRDPRSAPKRDPTMGCSAWRRGVEPCVAQRLAAQ